MAKKQNIEWFLGKKNPAVTLSKTEKMTWIAGYAFLVLVGWNIPEDVLTRYEWARSYTDFIAQFYPSVNWMSNLGVHIEINRFYQAFLFPFGILLFIHVWCFSIKYYADHYEKNAQVLVDWGYISVSIIFLLLIVYSLYSLANYEVGDYVTRAEYFFYYNRFGRGLMMPIFYTGLFIFLPKYLFDLKFLLQGRVVFVKDKKDKNDD